MPLRPPTLVSRGEEDKEEAINSIWNLSTCESIPHRRTVEYTKVRDLIYLLVVALVMLGSREPRSW